MARRAKKTSRALGPATTLVHGGIARSQFGETSEAIFLTQGYVYDTAEAAEARFKGDEPGHVYSRYSNPTVSMFEDRMRLMEGAEAARATATGMAAVNTALMAQLTAGDHVVAARALFGSCRYIIEDLLPRFGVRSTLVDGTDLAQWKKAMRKGKTKPLFLETPTNPTLDLIDIAAVADIAHKAGARAHRRQCLRHAAPAEAAGRSAPTSSSIRRPSTSTARAAASAASSSATRTSSTRCTRSSSTPGPRMSPFNAWVLLKGLETLPIRVRASGCLGGDPRRPHRRPSGSGPHPLSRSSGPSAGRARARQMLSGSTLIAFEVKGGKKGAFAVSNGLSIVRISNNLGDAKSLVTHPSTTTHQRLTEEARQELGISQALLRLSVGLEDVEDLWADIEHALDQAV